MSPKLKTGLLVGGISLVSIVVCVAAITLLFVPMSRSAGIGLTANDGAWPAAEPAVGASPSLSRGEMAAVEEMAEAEMAFPQEAPRAPDADMGGGSSGNTGSDINPQQQQRLIIRNGRIAVSVNNTIEARNRIEQMVKRMSGDGAFVVSVNEWGGREGSTPYIDMSIRVPSDRFDEVLNEIAGMAVSGTNPEINVSADDVTAEYVDVQARVESLEAARDRLLQLMENAQTTEELLMAEQQLTQREAELEALKGRMQYLAESARLSRIDITLRPYILSQPVDARWRPAETVRASLEALLRGMQGFGDFVIFFAIAVLPWLLAGGLVLFAVVKFLQWRLRARRERRAKQAGSAD
ncbi:MAG: DUF4349 domain-containing protein [Aggregatilineales bacterium]|nr:DUF4349 domain-containing protein [Chloroflexota bacterium]HOA24018.1 DUF4349 domain-containing protein [Aggregatilineales bacterium]